jgi:hypothetical protein
MAGGGGLPPAGSESASHIVGSATPGRVAQLRVPGGCRANRAVAVAVGGQHDTLGAFVLLPRHGKPSASGARQQAKASRPCPKWPGIFWVP